MTTLRLRGRPTDASKAAEAFADIADAARRPVVVTPDQARELKAITVATLAELRQTRGDDAGQLGPRSTLLAGTAAPLDGGEARYVWDQTSTAADDGVDTVEVVGVPVGRWRRVAVVPDDGTVGTDALADGAVTTAKIAGDAVTNAKLANMAEATIKGRAAGAGTGDPTDLTGAQVVTILGLPTTDVQVFTANGTWTKPANAKAVGVFLEGDAGGSGSGRRGAAGTVRCGGGGGGGGGISAMWFPAALLPSTVSVTVGQGGAGAAARTTDDTNGFSGTSGAGTSFGDFLRAGGGGAGNAGTATNGIGGNGGVGTMATGTPGASASTTGGAGTDCDPVDTLGGGGGAAGAGITAADATSDGGGGSSGGTLRTSPPAGGDGASGSTAATAGGSLSSPEVAGGGGGGSGASNGSSATQRAGAAGGSFGGGAGGGAASVNGTNSGAGAAGGPGIAVVVTVF